MSNEKDWRIRDQMDFLYGVELLHRSYSTQKENWDHDHCIFCWEKFQSNNQMGYCTKDLYYWVCEECFSDFKEMFNWKLVSE